MEEKKVPALRFRGFDNAWEHCKLGDVFEQTSNLVTLGNGEVKLWSLTVEDGLTPKTERYNREFLVKKDDKFKEVRPGDIVYNPMNMTLGAVGYNGMTRSVAVSGYYTTMIARENYDAYYINTWLKSSQAIKLYKIYATGSLIEKQRVQFPTLSIISASFPRDEEQKQIGSTFEKVDTLISLHQRKLEMLKKVKKSMLEKMFPKNDAKVPEVRFSDFTDAWEQHKLSELADIVGGGTPSTAISEYWDGDIDWYAPAEIADQIFVNLSQKKITTEGLNNSSAKMLPVGTVLFTSRAGIGKTAILTKEGCTNQGFQSIIPHKDELDSYFVFSRTDELKRYGETVGAGSTFVEVSGKQMANMTISIPATMGEQRQIGTYFRNLDNLIILHQRKLEKLKNIKKSMLEKMFII